MWKSIRILRPSGIEIIYNDVKAYFFPKFVQTFALQKPIKIFPKCSPEAHRSPHHSRRAPRKNEKNKIQNRNSENFTNIYKQILDFSLPLFPKYS